MKWKNCWTVSGNYTFVSVSDPKTRFVGLTAPANILRSEFCSILCCYKLSSNCLWLCPHLGYFVCVKRMHVLYVFTYIFVYMGIYVCVCILMYMLRVLLCMCGLYMCIFILFISINIYIYIYVPRIYPIYTVHTHSRSLSTFNFYLLFWF